MLGSLDVTKVPWGNCPTAWKGQFQGKEGEATLGLEAVADYNLWIWHSSFGFPGAMNDIVVWERSELFEAMQNGNFNKLDHQFEMDDVVFSQIYLLVDGIYPKLSRFLKSVAVPLTKKERYFAGWQEGARKDIERAFGVLKKKIISSYTQL